MIAPAFATRWWQPKRAIHHAQGASRATLDEDERLAFTLIHLLEIVGEACNQVSPEFQVAHPVVPWKKAIALRHRLAHGYFDVDLGIVWATVTNELPSLCKLLDQVLAEAPP
ncbi:MAG: hypothetical protein QOE90_27 [Thermoplasmata archaeon]|jgi:uncharacterized protein with HEPN domain|nr:hypothetical protein [Thermoplasmata archaeon]